MKIIVIGGGASGLTAAICAAGQGAKVTVLEAADRPAKKIYATGNGKCNQSKDGRTLLQGNGSGVCQTDIEKVRI